MKQPTFKLRGACVRAVAAAIAGSAAAMAAAQDVPQRPVLTAGQPAAPSPMAKVPTLPQLPALEPIELRGQPESLRSLLSRVLPSDPQVRGADVLSQVADQRVTQARSRLLPNLGLNYVGGQSDSTELGRPVDRTTDRSEWSLRWNLYNFGSDKGELDASRSDVLAAQQDQRRAREEVAERIGRSYVEVMRYQGLLGQSRQRIAEMQRLLGKVKIQHDAGKLAEADLLQAQASMLAAEVDHGQVVASLNAGMARLRTLAGGDLRPVVDTQDEVLGFADAVVASSGTPLDNPAGGNPGVIDAARLRADSAAARVLPQSAIWAPRIDLQYIDQIHDATTPLPTDTDRKGWQVTARWDLPLGGETIARRAESQLRAQAAQVEVERLQQVVDSERTSLPALIVALERSLRQLNLQIAQYTALIASGDMLFDAGRRSLTQLMQLHDNRYAAQQRRAEELERLRVSRIRLLALGGGLLPAFGL